MITYISSSFPITTIIIQAFEIALFEALYGRRYRSIVRWFEVIEIDLVGPNLVIDVMEKVRLMRGKIEFWPK